MALPTPLGPFSVDDSTRLPSRRKEQWLLHFAVLSYCPAAYFILSRLYPSLDREGESYLRVILSRLYPSLDREGESRLYSPRWGRVGCTHRVHVFC